MKNLNDQVKEVKEKYTQHEECISFIEQTILRYRKALHPALDLYWQLVRDEVIKSVVKQTL